MLCGLKDRQAAFFLNPKGNTFSDGATRLGSSQKEDATVFCFQEVHEATHGEGAIEVCCDGQCCCCCHSCYFPSCCCNSLSMCLFFSLWCRHWHTVGGSRLGKRVLVLIFRKAFLATRGAFPWASLLSMCITNSLHLTRFACVSPSVFGW